MRASRIAKIGGLWRGFLAALLEVLGNMTSQNKVMRRSLVLLLSVLVSVATLAFDGDIKGKIIDAATGEPMEFVTVSIYDGNGKHIKGVMSDSQGSYVFNGLRAGDYVVKFEFLGYKGFEKEIDLSTSSGSRVLDVKLAEDTQVLGEVEVVAQKPQMRFEIDKRVFNADQAIASIGGSASDLLSNVPSIDVDPEGTISLRGNSSVTIWINGKDAGLTSDNQSEILEQLPAESIDRIEVITNPSAKYSPEGTAGIINIVLKSDTKPGYYGSVQANADSRGGVRTSANINFAAGNWTGYLTAGYRHGRTKNGGYTNRDMTDGTYLYQTTDGLSKRDNGFFRGGLNYKASDKDVISLSGFAMVGGGSSDNTIDYVSDIPGNYNSAVRQTLGNNTMRGGNIMLSYDHTFDLNKTLSLSASRNIWKMMNDNDYWQTSDYTDYTTQSLQRQSSDINNAGWEFQADYSNAFNDNHKIEAGYKGELGDETSPLFTLTGTGESDLQEQRDLDNTFKYKRNVQAAYLSYSGKIGNLGMMFGLRGEYSIIKTSSDYYTADGTGNYIQGNDSFDKRKFDLFPSVFFSYSLPAGNELQLNYTRRIRRPWGGMLNSFTNITDSTNISRGNPDLDPQYSNSFELNYIKNWEKHMLSLSTYYRSTNDVFERISYIDDNNVMNSTWFNVTQSIATGAEVVVKNKIFGFIDLTTTVNLYYSKLNGFDYVMPSINARVTGEKEESFAYDAKMIANFMLPYDISLQLTGSYRSRETIAQGTREPNYMLDAGISKSFMDGKINLALTGRDLLDSRRRHTVTSGTGYTQESESWRRGRTIRLTVSYSFGNMKAGRNKNNSNEGETMSGEVYGEY